MIIKGKARGDAGQLGRYLMDNAKKQNSRIHIFDVRSGTARDVKTALRDIELSYEGKGKKPLYSVEICPAIGEDKGMTREDWLLVADNIEKEMEFGGQDRVLVCHEKIGQDGQTRLHVHAVWSRVKDGKLLPINHNYLKHDRAREASEIALRHKRTLQPKDIKHTLSGLWYNSTDGQDFINKAYKQGFLIAKGERRAYTVRTPDGQKLDFVRQLQGVKTAAVKDRFKDIEASWPDERHLEGQKREREKENKRRDRTMSKNQKRAFAGEREKGRASYAQAATAANDNRRDMFEKQEADRNAVNDRQKQEEQEKLERERLERERQQRKYGAGVNFQDVTQPQKPEQTTDERESEFHENKDMDEHQTYEDHMVDEAIRKFKRAQFGRRRKL